ncbi:hypothetical protein ACFOW1_09730 [Parasediminibacterium paludis]|uniref:PKD/Chitinase domain-containing protein n=1 Tax=Parasediminibacterium paludis TaxID=908966 RepID=A0ABV8PYQ2_9BACT
MLLILSVAACTKNNYNDTSFIETAAVPSNISTMFTITQDNTGLVTITPNGTGASSYDIYFGDNASPVNIPAGKSVNHTYAEGVYTVKVVGYNVAGKTATASQTLTVSYRMPQNLKLNVSTSGVSVTLSATALYATYFKVYFGDSLNVNPLPVASVLGGQSITHQYPSAGKYVITVIALSGGAATAQITDTIKVANQINLPVTFDDPSVDYTVSDFGGNASVLTKDPTNANNWVMQSTKTGGAQTWAGTTVGTGLGFATKIPITATNNKMTVMVYSPAAGLDIKLKLDDHTRPNAGYSVETDVLTTKANQWETLTFDFSKPASGTPAWSAANTYDLASIFFDFNTGGSGKVFYWDNLQMQSAPPVLSQINLPVTFESTTVDYTMSDFGGNVSTFTTDPVNANNHVMKSIKTSGAQTWAGTTVGTPLGFATLIPITTTKNKMTVMVYSPAAGLDIKLKLDDHTRPNAGYSVETDALTTVANQWETLTFDFSKNSSGTPAFSSANKYDLVSIFFDFNVAGSGKVFYWDNVILL